MAGQAGAAPDANAYDYYDDEGYGDGYYGDDAAYYDDQGYDDQGYQQQQQQQPRRAPQAQQRSATSSGPGSSNSIYRRKPGPATALSASSNPAEVIEQMSVRREVTR